MSKLFLFHFLASNADYPVPLNDCSTGWIGAVSSKKAEEKLGTVYRHVLIVGRSL